MSNLATNIDLTQIWTSICLELQQVVSADAVSRWFRPLRVQDYSNRTLTLATDNSILKLTSTTVTNTDGDSSGNVL